MTVSLVSEIMIYLKNCTEVGKTIIIEDWSERLKDSNQKKPDEMYYSVSKHKINKPRPPTAVFSGHMI